MDRKRLAVGWTTPGGFLHMPALQIKKIVLALAIAAACACKQDFETATEYHSPFLSKHDFMVDNFNRVPHRTPEYQEKLVHSMDFGGDEYHYFWRPAQFVERFGWRHQSSIGKPRRSVPLNLSLRLAIYNESLFYRLDNAQIRIAESLPENRPPLATMQTTRIVEQAHGFLSVISHSECPTCNYPSRSVEHKFMVFDASSLEQVSMQRVFKQDFLLRLLAPYLEEYGQRNPAECRERLRLTSLEALESALTSGAASQEVLGFLVYRDRIYIDMRDFIRVDEARHAYSDCDFEWVPPWDHDILLLLGPDGGLSDGYKSQDARKVELERQ
jgi:hypothetical protein